MEWEITMSKLTMMRELWGFLRANKRWWLLPILVVLILLGVVLVLTEGSALAPFVYSLF